MVKQIQNILLIVGLGLFMSNMAHADLSESASFQVTKLKCGTDLVACFDTATGYMDGIGTEKDEEKGIEYYKKACQEGKGFIEACYNVARALCDDEGIDDHGIAVEYYKMAADGGDKEANEMLFYLYSAGGVGLMVDKEKALFYGEKACNKGKGNLKTCQALAFSYVDIADPSSAQSKKGAKLYKTLCEKRRDGNSCEMVKTYEEMTKTDEEMNRELEDMFE